MKNLFHFGYGDTQENFIFLEGPEGTQAPVSENKDSQENPENEQLELEMQLDARFSQVNQKMQEFLKKFTQEKGKKPEEVVKIMGFSSIEEFKNAKEAAKTSQNGINDFEKRVQMLENVYHGFPPSFESFEQGSSMEDQELAMSLLQEDIKDLEKKGDFDGVAAKKAELEKTQAECQNMILGVNVFNEKHAPIMTVFRDTPWLKRGEGLIIPRLDGGVMPYQKLETGGKALEVTYYEKGETRTMSCTIIEGRVYEFTDAGNGNWRRGMIESDRFRVDNGKIVPQESFDQELHDARKNILLVIRGLGGDSFGSFLTLEGQTFTPSVNRPKGEDFKKGLSYNNSSLGTINILPTGAITFNGILTNNLQSEIRVKQGKRGK